MWAGWGEWKFAGLLGLLGIILGPTVVALGIVGLEILRRAWLAPTDSLAYDHQTHNNLPQSTDSDISKAAAKEDKEKVKWLSSFYEELAKECQKPDYEAVSDVYRAAKTTINKQFMTDEIANLRDVIGKRLNQKLPKDSSLKLDQKTRDLLSSEFNQIAKELK